MVNFSTQGRDRAYDLIVEAIKTAIQHCHTHDTLTAHEQEPTNVKKKPKGVHSHKGHSTHDGDGDGAGSDPGTTDLATIFRQRVLEKHKTVDGAFDNFKEADGSLSRKAFKALVGSLGMSISDQQRKLLRKKVSVSKAISFDKFSAFMHSDGQKTQDREQVVETSALAELPSEVPRLPAS